jgi:uncharacterized protein
VLRIVVAIVVALILLKLLAWRLEPAMVFYPTRGESATPEQLGIRYEALRLRASDGVEITAWQLEPEHPRADIVYFHGNGGNLSIWLDALATLHSLGYNVLAIDYRGYGTSEGSPSEKGLFLDAEAAVRYATRAPRQRPLIYWGRSLGGPVAAAASRVVSPDALILESTFPDKAAMIRTSPLLRMLNVFAAYKFDTVGMANGIGKPILVAHGDRDTIIPFALGRELFDRLDAPKQFITLRDADHNDFFGARHEAYWAPIRAFLDKL